MNWSRKVRNYELQKQNNLIFKFVRSMLWLLAGHISHAFIGILKANKIWSQIAKWRRVNHQPHIKHDGASTGRSFAMFCAAFRNSCMYWKADPRDELILKLLFCVKFWAVVPAFVLFRLMLQCKVNLLVNGIAIFWFTYTPFWSNDQAKYNFYWLISTTSEVRDYEEERYQKCFKVTPFLGSLYLETPTNNVSPATPKNVEK